jgi:hypothetical protein
MKRLIVGATVLLSLGLGGWIWGAHADSTPTMEIRWSIYDKDVAGERGNGFSSTCGAAKASTITFTVQNLKTRQVKKTTNVPCPAAEQGGLATIQLPDNTGPFAITGQLDGVAKSTSTKVCNVLPNMGVDVWLFVRGCTNPKCLEACQLPAR